MLTSRFQFPWLVLRTAMARMQSWVPHRRIIFWTLRRATIFLTHSMQWVAADCRNLGRRTISQLASGELNPYQPCKGTINGSRKHEFNFVALLKACGKRKDLDEGTRLHAAIVKQGLLQQDIHLAGTLISMYAKCGVFSKAHQILEELPVRNLITWSALIAGYVQQDSGQEALICFEQMKSEGLSPDAVTFTCILKACGSMGAMDKGKQIHDEVVNKGFLENDPVLGTALVDMYAKCGAFRQAQQVIEELPCRSDVIWNPLITGYMQNEQCHEAFHCFEQMRSDGFFPNAVTFTSILKACGITRSIKKGREIHVMIVDSGFLLKDIALGNSLVDMYIKCGEIEEAQSILQELPVRNVVSWSSMIAGYVQEERGAEALICLKQMQSEGILPNEVTFICLLKACADIASICNGSYIHNEIISRGSLEKDILVGNALVDMYVKCGVLEKAHQVFEEFVDRDVVTWSILLSGYLEQGKYFKALVSFEQMQNEGIVPNSVTFVFILKACSNIKAIDMGNQIHDRIVIMGLLQDQAVVLGTALVDMYAKCGFLSKAKSLLERLPIRDTVAWSALIAGYVHHGQYYEALGCFEWMQTEGLSPDDVTFISILKVCGMTGDIEKGKQIHNEIANNGPLERHTLLGTALVDMYARCGMLSKAEQVLSEILIRDVVSWSALISGYAQQGRGVEAFQCLRKMQNEGLSPDSITFICILKACGTMRAVDKGKQIHEEIVSRGILKKDILLGTALVNMYARCGALAKAHEVLEELPTQNVISWSTLIAGYVQQGQGTKALDCFYRMRNEGLSPDGVTFISILRACGITRDLDKVENVHEDIVRRGLLEKDIRIGNALIDMYCKCGMLLKAQDVLEVLPLRDVISWNTLITGYVNHGQYECALTCFEQLRHEGLSPTTISYIGVLKACGDKGAIDKGEQIHDEIVRRILLSKDIMLVNALVDMYARCGLLGKAEHLLNNLPSRDIVSWNTLIGGHALRGHGQEALACFRRMQKDGLFPNELTCLCVLNACSHSGLLDDAQEIFGNMIVKYGIFPSLEHHICMVIAFGNVGHFDKAMSVIKSMPSPDCPDPWLALLGVCSKWGNVKLASLAFDQAIQLDNNCATAYVLMANIFASANMLEDAEKIETMRRKYSGRQVVRAWSCYRACNTESNLT